MARLPQPGSDKGTWGDILNDYLAQTHDADGTLKANIVTSAQLADNSVTVAAIADGSITETQLSGGVQTKLNAVSGVSSVAGRTGVVALTKADVGLSLVDNTSDANKPVSTTQQTALDLKAPLASTAQFVIKLGGTWGARPTADANILVIWVGLDPSPSIVTSGTGGMYNNDIRIIPS